jgi:quinol-cytochrome oxidoreductase complex cytochrome b subunit
LVAAVLFLFLFSISSSNHLFSGCMYSPLTRVLFWTLVGNFLLLTWLGRCPAESPYTEVALALTVSYFTLIRVMCILPHLTTYFYLS